MPPPKGERASSRTSASPVQVLSVPESWPITVRFLSGYAGLDTHWKGRTVPCEGHNGECPSSLHKQGCIWKGYAPVELWDEVGRVWRPSVLEITESLEEGLRGRDLRGEVWTLFRSEKRGRSDPVQGVFCERLPDAKVSPPFDILPVLLRLFHRSELKLGRKNPLPAKVVLEAVQGDAPRLPSDLVEQSTPQNNPETVSDLAAHWKKLREEQAEKDRARARYQEQPGRNGSAHHTNGTH